MSGICEETATIVGFLEYVQPGEQIKCQGRWFYHKEFGRQFQVESFISIVPATTSGIEKYLASGMIKGIGPKLSKRLVDKFGEKTLDVIEEELERLREVEGIGSRRVKKIGEAWQEQKNVRDVMIFLRGHDISPAYAAKIYKTYGDASIALLQKNPFQIADDIRGIGFKTADKIAEKVGLSKDSPYRIKASLVYLLKYFADSMGHVCVPRKFLENKCREMIEIDDDKIKKALDELTLEKKTISETLEENEWVFLALFYYSEIGIVGLIQSILTSDIFKINDTKVLFDSVQNRLNFEMTSRQREAVSAAFTHPLILISGGPGTGKTTIVRAIVEGFSILGKKVLLTAPTGRAAKRLSEVTAKPASTIHRLLEFSPSEGGFKKNKERPLHADILIVDEFSMVDLILAYNLFKAIPPGCRLVIVGDSNQLPSVGAGQVLHDFISSGKIPLFSLDKIFRQAEQSLIITNAHKICRGEYIYIPPNDPKKPLRDFYFIEEEEPEKTAGKVVELVKERIPRRFNLDPIEDIQVLSPMKRGVIGTTALNTMLQEAMTDSKKGASVTKYGKVFRVGDKVMQTVNNYEKDIFNGNIGIVKEVNHVEHEIHVLFDDGVVPYDFADLDELIHSYAVTVHKSQGCEYPAVVMPILTQHYLLLQRNLLYTAVTRAKKLLVIVGSKRAIGIAISNNKEQNRFGLLKNRLYSACP